MIYFVDNMEIPGRYPDEVQGSYSISHCNEMVHGATVYVRIKYDRLGLFSYTTRPSSSSYD